tara:strand:+ start:15 stop:461 length:447 start_codon:yes stop_codon:yes gene_type:complete
LNVDFLGEPIAIPEIPEAILPEPVQIPIPTLELPKADIPSYTPLVAPPADLRPPPGVKPYKEEKKPPTEAPRPPFKPQLPPEVRKFDVPYTDYSVPMPSTDILVTATTTATVSVAATLTATAIFKRLVSIMKPIIKKILTKKNKNAKD